MLTSYRRQKFSSFQIRCCVLEAELQNIHNLRNLRRTKLSGLLTLLLIVNWTGLIENQSWSSGGCSHGTLR